MYLKPEARSLKPEALFTAARLNPRGRASA
jgi:hypothetical protein